MIVMKFGGTSVADSEAISRVINIIKEKPGKKIVIVSAIAKSTRTLTKAFILASQKKDDEYKKEIGALKKKHEKIAHELISDENLLYEAEIKIKHLFSELDIALEEASKNPDDRNMAEVLAFGELLSSVILHAAMLENKIKSELIDAREIIITDNTHKEAEPILKKITYNAPSILNKYLDFGSTIVTQGFIASNPEGETTLLGLEGSDLSASLIGMAMDAKEIQIWTDVNGIMTSDPKTIKNTKNIPALSFEEAANLSALGAKVIHPKTIEPAASKNIPIKILNSLNAKLPGTLISDKSESGENKIKSITYKEDIKIANIPAKENDLQKILSVFKDQNMNIDAVIESENILHLVFNGEASIDDLPHELKSSADITFEENSSLIGIIGKFSQDPREMLENILKILDGFAVKMIVYDSSSTSIILVIEKNDLVPAIQELHDILLG